MKTIKLFMILLLAFTTGCLVTLWAQNKDRMQDEYAYSLWVNNALFMQHNNDATNINKTLNNLLYAHLNRYLVAKSYTPEFLVTEENKLMCSQFSMMSSEDREAYKALITKEGLYGYIQKNYLFVPASMATYNNYKQRDCRTLRARQPLL